MVATAALAATLVSSGTRVDASPPLSPPIYGIQAPSADPGRQQHTVVAADGTELFVETWLPAPQDGHVPPERVPVVVSISPYLAEGAVESTYARDTLVPRGYAYANAHVRGTGQSGGCIDLFGPLEADDSARVIEYLGRDAPFSDGHVGGYGVSYPGGTILSAAGRGDPARTRWLDAVVAIAPYHASHEAQWTFDGVPSAMVGPLMVANYTGTSFGFDQITYTGSTPLSRIPERPGCVPANLLGGTDQTGDHTPWHAARDNRAWTDQIRAATLIAHGHADLRPVGGSPPSIEVGLFDHLPARTPHKGIFGVFGHSRPPGDRFTEQLVAWFDRWLKGRGTGVESWPTAQVQDTSGSWFAADGWPATGGRPGSLALGPGGRLGGAGPAHGTTTYVEACCETSAGSLPGTTAVFETAPLPGGSSIVGQPVLDLWVTLAAPDAHLVARLETFDAAGRPIADGMTYGARSAQHLAPFEDDRFVQPAGVPAPVGVPVLVPVRFQPTALAVPPGGRVRLTIAGTLIVNEGAAALGIPEPVFLGPTLPSGVIAPVTIHHDPAHPSTLRFLSR